MSFLAALPLIGNLINGAENIFDQIVVDKDKKIAIEAGLKQIKLETENRLLEMQHAELMGQIQVNQEEAKSKSIFVAGWRPFVGWSCGAAFAYNFMIQPLLTFILISCGVNLDKLPTLDISQMMPVLLGMLGLGAMRSYEKKNGVNSK